MMLPTIHSNGTSPKSLLEDYMKASASLRQAIHDLEEAGPNGRDYYPQGPGAFTVAQEEHENRLERLESVRRELVQIMDHVADFV